MPGPKADNARKIIKRPVKETPQKISTGTYDSVQSEESFEVPNSPAPSESVRNGTGGECEEIITQDFSGEMSKLLERFNSDVSKSMQAKRKKLEQFTHESTRSTTKKVLEANKNQTAERSKLIDNFQSQFYNLIRQGEIELEKVKEAEDKIQKLLVQQQKHQQQVRATHLEMMNAFKNLCEEFFKGINDLEESHVEQYSTILNEMRKEMAMLQKKILMETQQQEMMNVRKNLSTLSCLVSRNSIL